MHVRAWTREMCVRAWTREVYVRACPSLHVCAREEAGTLICSVCVISYVQYSLV